MGVLKITNRYFLMCEYIIGTERSVHTILYIITGSFLNLFFFLKVVGITHITRFFITLNLDLIRVPFSVARVPSVRMPQPFIS